MRYRSVPYEVQAVQFIVPFQSAAPNWLLDAYKTGKVSTTINGTNKFFSIYSEDNMTRGFVGDYICMSEKGRIYMMKQDDFAKAFERIDNDNVVP